MTIYSCTEAFVYKWTDQLRNMIYIGIHKGCPDDGYVCSSKYMMEEYLKRPLDFTREIICYGSYDECYKIETQILQNRDETWYNKSSNNFRRVGFTPEQAKFHSEKMKKWHAQNEHPMKGKTHTAETRKKISQVQKKIPSEIKARGGRVTSLLGKSGFKMQIKCEKCGLTTNVATMVSHKKKCDRINYDA
jgi:hypothetical protein